jgi:hypothetical protein
MKNSKVINSFNNISLLVQDNPFTSLCESGMVTLRVLDKQL